MNKEQVDELYHLLRVVSNMKGTGAAGMGWFVQEEIDTIFGITRHLLAGGDYLALVKFSAYYGRRFLLQRVCDKLTETGWNPSRIVELGAGLGWFGRGVAAHFETVPCLFVDKRPWTLVNVVASLETEEGLNKVLSVMKDGDLIVAADLLHCLDDPKDIVLHFSKWPMAILEYCPTDIEYAASYSTQIRRYGATPIEPDDFAGVFPGRRVDIVDLDPYILLLVEARK